jgi:hypothetical protein
MVLKPMSLTAITNENRHREGSTWRRGTMGAEKNSKERRAQRTVFRVFPYIIKPPFPSDGGCAAASAGRSGPVGPSVGHVRGVRASAPSRLHSRPERQLAHADAPAFSDGGRGFPLDQIHCSCFVAWRTVVRGQGPKRNHEPDADFFSQQLP